MKNLTKEDASATIEDIKKKIKDLWDECAKIADTHRVTFYFEGPTGYGSGGVYYPPIPPDWVEGYDYDDKDPNKDHPEWEEYHPWNDGQDGWVSSSDRC